MERELVLRPAPPRQSHDEVDRYEVDRFEFDRYDADRHGGRPRPPPPTHKRLIVCADGTWHNADDGMLNGELETPSNVARLSRAIKSVGDDGVPQIVYYQRGVGTRGNVVERVVSGVTGDGVRENILSAYSFLCNNWAPGDEMILTGFSRGAFTVRSVAGFVAVVGLLTKRGLRCLPEIFRDVQNRRNPDYRSKNPDVPFPDKPSANDPRYAEELESRGLTTLDVRIKAVAVWDTVGSLGVPRFSILTRFGLQSNESEETQFYDTKLSNCIEYAFQALALDERRSAYAPAVWEKPRGNRTVLRQVWFPGTHSNIGGGNDDQSLANITLAWMMAQLEPFLDMRMSFVLEMDDEMLQYYHSYGKRDRPWSFGMRSSVLILSTPPLGPSSSPSLSNPPSPPKGKIEDSLTGVFALGGGTTRTPGQYYAVDPLTERETTRPLRDTHEYIHPSARARLALRGPGPADKGRYDPPALDDWRLVVDYPDDGDGDGYDGGGAPPRPRPDVLWIARFPERNVSARILPESPLWGPEKALLARDPDVEAFVARPPEMGGRRRRGRRRGPAREGEGEEWRMVEDAEERRGGRRRGGYARSLP
ncbi:hypothetical protein BDY21DRAFT_374914 [Lineolata rhizophorae]|uniref:T6SS Phospholipase effector Tle1-like catalytic domain-containing protein n=1 Tax=Lineolata rhizophorae TaxID=578093 RepID=A0A6A6NNK2_9PEZI|nr:hypothetical protein BDY21DRAFT_374914 [Lineolata rhizophorae]